MLKLEECLKMNRIEKFEQVFLYVLNEVGSKSNIGETVLHKLMYFIDFDYYEKYKKSLTGIEYKKNLQGLTFDHSLLKQMEDKNFIQCVRETVGRYEQKKYIALKNAELTNFSAIEIKHIDKTLAQHSDKTATQIKEYSYGDVPWVITNDRETIPYESVFYRSDLYSVKELEDEL